MKKTSLNNQPKIPQWMYLIVLLLFFITPVVSDENCEKGTEPTVTKKEAELLDQVIQHIKDQPQKAINMISDAYTEDSSASLDFALANCHFQLDQLDHSILWYKKAISKHHDFIRAKENLSKVYIAKERYQEAFNLLVDIYDHGIIKKDNLLLMGFLLLNQNKSISAEAYYREIIKRYPYEIKGYLGLAKSTLMQERFNDTIGILKEILIMDPFKEEVWLLLSNCYMQKNETMKSIVTLESARTLGLLNFGALSTLGDLYLHEDMADKALSIFKNSLEQESIAPKRLIRAAQGFIMAEEYGKAEELLKKLSQSSHKADQEEKLAFTLDLLKAKILLYKGNLKESENILNNLLVTDPMNGELVILLAKIYENMNQIEKAKYYYQMAIELKHNKRHALIRLAMLEVKSKNLQKAIDLFHEAQEIKFQTNIEKYKHYLESLVIPE